MTKAVHLSNRFMLDVQVIIKFIICEHIFRTNYNGIHEPAFRLIMTIYLQTWSLCEKDSGKFGVWI
jgi:hypothetical protein